MIHELALGPIEVRGARAGETLAVRVDELRPGGWGVAFGGGAPFGLSLDGESEALASVVVDLRITQNVNGVRCVRAVLRDDAIR